MSANDRPEDVDLSREAGADAYVIKSAPNAEIIACMALAQHMTQQRGKPPRNSASP